MHDHELSPVSDSLRFTAIPIAQLSPEVQRLEEERSLHSVVTLLWPYSSSTKSLGLLLAEPDFRLRRSNGQVKAFFHGVVAEEVAKAQVGIGDSVFLSLAGSRVVKNDEVAQTPGKNVPWVLHFDNSVLLEIWRGSELLSTVRVDRSPSHPATPNAPVTNGHARTYDLLDSTSWQSPAFQRSRTSLGFTHSAFDPFAEEDGFVPGKGRKRTRFSIPSHEWRVIDEPESPGDRDLPDGWTAIFDEELAIEPDVGEERVSQDAETTDIPPPADTDVAMVDVQSATPESSPPRPTDGAPDESHFLRPDIPPKSAPSEFAKPSVDGHPSHLPTDTPRLQPVASPGLPVPSPLGAAPTSPGGYFISVADASGRPQATPPITSVSQAVSEPGRSAPQQVQIDQGAIDRDKADVASPAPNGEVQELPKPISTSQEATSAPNSKILGNDEARNAIALAVEPGKDREATPGETDVVETAVSEAPEESDFEGSLEGEEGRRTGSPGMADEEYVESDDQMSDRESQGSEEDSDIMSAVGSEDGEESNAEDFAITPQNGRERTARVESVLSEGSQDRPHKPGQYSEFDEEDEEDSSDRDQSAVSDYEHDSGEEIPQSGFEKDGEDRRVEDRNEESEYEDYAEEEAQRIEKEDEDRGNGDLSEESDYEEDYAEEKAQHRLGKEDEDRRNEDQSEESDYEEDDEDERPRSKFGKDGGNRSEWAKSDEGDYDEDSPEAQPNSRREDAYSDSESEVESEYESDYTGIEEEPQPRFPLKNVEPEVIVLDSDSEDEAPTQGPDDGLEQKARESDVISISENDSYDSDAGGYSVDEMDDVEGQEEEEVDEDQEEEEGQEEDENEEEEEYAEDERHEQEEADRVESDDSEDERLVAEEYPASERIGKEPHFESLAKSRFEAIQERPDVGMGGIAVEVPSQDPAHRELPELRESSEEISKDYSPGANGHSLEYIATTPGSVEHVHVGSGSAQHLYDDMAIDPNLYYSGPTQRGMDMEASSQDSQSEPPIKIEGDTPWESPQSIHKRHLALQLDGAGWPELVAESTHELHVSTRQYQQLITSGPSQAVVTSQPSPVSSAGEVLPTPDFTQNKSPSRSVAGSPPPTLAAADTCAVTEGAKSPRAVRIQSEVSPGEPRRAEEREPEPPMVVVEAEVPEFSVEDQTLQGSIEVDDELDTGRVRLAPIDRRYPGLRSKLSYFAPLASLIDHYNALVDTISIASEVLPATRAKSGKKDFILTLQLTDQSMGGAPVFAQILRPYKSALPSLTEGDSILLRNFRVKSFNHSVILVSDSTSAWAVFSASSTEPEMNGPPVEYGDEEKNFATDLRQWYLEDGMAMVADYQLQASVERESRAGTPASSAAWSDAGSVDLASRAARGGTSVSSQGSRRRRSHRRVTIHELRNGTKYAEVGSPSDRHSIHELRDGTVYAHL